MKTATIPYPREFGVGDSGSDCLAVKRALAHVLDGPHGMSVKTKTFAKTAGENLADWKLSVGLLHIPEYTEQAHSKLIAKGAFDEHGAALMAQKAYSLQAIASRTQYVHAWEWAIQHHALNHYIEARPIPYWIPPFSTTTEVKTDCSGESALLAYWEKLPDPGGMAFNGQDNTGTILHHCTRIPIAQALPGELVVYRKGSWDFYGHHVAAVLGRLPNGDLRLGSNGHQGDPNEYLHSAMAATQARGGYPDVVVCRWLPVPLLEDRRALAGL